MKKNIFNYILKFIKKLHPEDTQNVLAIPEQATTIIAHDEDETLAPAKKKSIGDLLDENAVSFREVIDYIIDNNFNMLALACLLYTSNLYGPGDNYHPENSHVIPALIRRFHEAKKRGAAKVTIWGTGTALREFLHVDDMADACIFLLENYSDFAHINVGSQREWTIMEVAQLIAKVVGFEGEIDTDATKPDGTPRKLMDSGKLFSMGWNPRVEFEAGLRDTYSSFCKTVE